MLTISSSDIITISVGTGGVLGSSGSNTTLTFLNNTFNGTKVITACGGGVGGIGGSTSNKGGSGLSMEKQEHQEEQEELVEMVEQIQAVVVVVVKVVLEL